MWDTRYLIFSSIYGTCHIHDYSFFTGSPGSSTERELHTRRVRLHVPHQVQYSTVQHSTVQYTCSPRSRIRFTPRFFEYKVVWPNRGGGFGITEIVDVVNLQTEEARRYHEPRVLDTSIFFPMNWTFQLTCDRIRPDDCVFNPVTDTKQPRKSYDVKLNNLQVTIVLAFLVVTSYGTESADAYFVCTCFLLLYVCI